MYNYLPTDADHIRVYGRTVSTVPMPLFWTASGFEFDTDSTECWIDMECDYNIREMYLRVELDGFLIQRFMIPKGRNKYCLYRDMPVGELKTVTVIIEVQPIQDDQERKLLVYGIETDCVLQPVIPKSCRIEIIGDSLTSGEGLTGTSNIQDWNAGIFGLTGHYGLTIARHFDADYSIVSQSGWGVYCGWDNNIHCNIPDYYTKVCGVLTDDMNGTLGAHDEWDFTSWQPDLVIVNLGTNDGASTDSPAWTDPDTGKTYKQAQITGEGWESESKKRFEDSTVNFLQMIREKNPDAYIIWVYGMCGPLMEPYIMEAVERYKIESGDARVWYQALPECPEDKLGAHGHPGASHHLKCADVIISEINRLGVLK